MSFEYRIVHAAHSRFIVIEGSGTGHCCYSHTVLDTKGVESGPVVFTHICETTGLAAAVQVCDALNKATAS